METLTCGCIVTTHGGHKYTQLCTTCRTALFNQHVRDDSTRRAARLAPPPAEDFSDLI